jgi:hypothetical protein
LSKTRARRGRNEKISNIREFCLRKNASNKIDKRGDFHFEMNEMKLHFINEISIDEKEPEGGEGKSGVIALTTSVGYDKGTARSISRQEFDSEILMKSHS